MDGVQKMSNKRKLIFAAVGIFVFLALLPFPQHFSGMKNDPDRFYHFAISRIYAEKGFPQTLPQAEDIGWGDFFGEKEFLFHVFTGIGSKIAGDMGVLWFSWGLFAALATTLGLILGIGSRTLWLIPLGALAVPLTTGIFSIRMLMVRPHVFAILLMTWQIFAWSRGWWIAACVFGGAYVLAYHAIYIPVFISGVFLTCWHLSGRNIKRPAMWAILAIFIGVLVNPAFPQNILIGFQVLQIATNNATQIPWYDFGMELKKLSSDRMLRMQGFYLILPFILISLAMFYGVWRADRKNSIKPLSHPEIAATLIIAATFSILTFLSPRGFEILVPATFIAVATLVPIFKSPGRWTAAFLVLASVIMGYVSYGSLKDAKTSDLKVALNDEIAEELKAIPLGESPKVFNWGWAISPYIFYNRPDLRFIDLLDPTFLFKQSPEKYDIRRRVREGRHPDPWRAIRWDFNSDYVIIPEFQAQRLLSDPHFTRLSTNTSSQNKEQIPIVLKVAHERIDRFVTHYKVGIKRYDKNVLDLVNVSMDPFSIEANKSWPSVKQLESDDKSPTPIFVDTFETWLQDHKPDAIGPKENDKTTLCMRASASSDDLKRLQSQLSGKKYLGIGGGPWFAIWINGQPFYKTKSLESPLTINRLLDLSPFEKTKVTSVEALVCTLPAANLSGLILSIWSAEDLKLFCKEKPTAMASATRSSQKDWLLNDLNINNCLGAPIVQASSTISDRM